MTGSAGGAVVLRPAMAEDKMAIARLWQESWHLSHAALLPPEVVAFRDAGFFARRSREILGQTELAERAGVLAGFAAWAGSEVDELFVAHTEYGRGTAAMLLARVEAILMRQGVQSAELFCAMGNARAERFYAKHGWTRGHTFWTSLDSTTDPCLVEAIAMAKSLSGAFDQSDMAAN